MRIGEWIMIVATLLGPILAVQAQKWIERWRLARDRKTDVFTKLMTSRAAPLSVQHVEALNQIDLEFHGDKKYKKVTEAWKAYYDQLCQKVPEGESQYVVWATKKNDLLADLLYEMGKSLGYDFDKVHIKRAAYFPKFYDDIELDQLAIRKAFVAWLKGDIALPLKVVELPRTQEPDVAKEAIGELLNMLQQVGLPVSPVSEISPKEDGRVPVQPENRASVKT